MKKLNTALFLTMVLGLFLETSSAYSTRAYNKQWVVATVIGSMPVNPVFKYYLEPQLRFIDDHYFFNQTLQLGGLGYQFNKNITLFAGPGWVITKTPSGQSTHETRYWQQLNWLILNKSSLNINSRTRLEERERTDTAQMAVRFRQRIWMRIPFEKWERHSFSIFDELFFNLNHPYWVSPYLLEQNRAFVGITTQLSKSMLVDIGYLNQYLRPSNTNSISDHVFLVSFTITN